MPIVLGGYWKAKRWTVFYHKDGWKNMCMHCRPFWLWSLPTKEIQKTASERLPVKGGFGTISAQPSSQVRMAFRGTFRTMQRAFLELETRMPQLQLQELRIDPSTSQSSLLNFQVTYTAWEN